MSKPVTEPHAPKPPLTPICANCVFWKAVENQPGWGRCRCNPPVVMTWKGETLFGVKSHWPECSGGDWCGKYEEKPS